MSSTPRIDDARFTVSPPVDRDETEVFCDILHRSLFFPTLDQYDWIATEGIENFRLIRLDQRVVGGFTVQRMGQWFGEKSIPCGAVRCVGTAPEVRAQGVATKMLSAMLEELYNDGIPLASLYPSTQPIYRRVGFEQAGARLIYMMPSIGIDLRERHLEMRPATAADKPTFQRLYKERALETNGHMDRSDWIWDVRLLSERGGKPIMYLICDGDDVQGYVIYHQRPEKNIVDGEIHVRDMVLRTGAAAKRLWTFFADQRSSMRRIYWTGGTQEPLMFWLADQNILKIIENWRWLLRIVNVPKALEARGYNPHVTETLHIEVDDPILPANQGRFVVNIDQGTAQVQPGGDGHIKLHIRALASIFSGYLSATDAQSTGLIDGDPAYLRAMNFAFAGPQPWMPEMF